MQGESLLYRLLYQFIHEYLPAQIRKKAQDQAGQRANSNPAADLQRTPKSVELFVDLVNVDLVLILRSSSQKSEGKRRTGDFILKAQTKHVAFIEKVNII